MKKISLNGMRDIPTIQGLHSRSVPATQPQTATELARLEHEKARLERELKMWFGNQKRTESRLMEVEERLALVKQVMGLVTVEDPTKRPKPRRSPSPKADAGSDEGGAQGWREISLEY